MIVLSILVFVMGVLCAWMLYMGNEFNFRLRRVQEELDKAMTREIDVVLLKAQMQDIKECLVGYEFALKTMEEYMKESMKRYDFSLKAMEDYIEEKLLPNHLNGTAKSEPRT